MSSNPYVLAFDLGTGGTKATLFEADGTCVSSSFEPYETFYPRSGWHEQKPEDWWNAIRVSTRRLLQTSKVKPDSIVACAISGQSLGIVPVAKDGSLLLERTPIWSDSRAGSQARRFFERVDEDSWYTTTGNGFPPALYTIFKVMWLQENLPEVFARTDKIMGSKDYINYRLTGKLVTDYSYASGSGVYDLASWKYSEDLLIASEVPASLLPEIVSSSQPIGRIEPGAAKDLGLSSSVIVVAGGVDNSCMALGARNTVEGRVYNSLGSSSWVAVSSEQPLIDLESRPYVFAHVLPGLYTSALSIFSAGSSFRWVRDVICSDLVRKAREERIDTYDLMTELASQSPAGANGLIFNPSLAGGTNLDASPNIRGALIGIDLKHNRADVIRSAMEGIAMGLAVAIARLRELTQIESEMLVVGGGGASKLWRQILADVLGVRIVKSQIDQQAAALGAGALACVGAGLWQDFARIDTLHTIEHSHVPDAGNRELYQRMLAVYRTAAVHQAELGDRLIQMVQGG